MANLDSKYTTEIFNGEGELIADVTGFARRRNLKKMRNRADSFSFDLDLQAIKTILAKSEGITSTELLQVNINEVRFKRGDVVLMAGQIIQAQKTANADRQEVHVDVAGWLDLLGFRYTDIPLSYNGIDAGLIAAALIEYTQALTDGDFGITIGSIQTSQTRVRNYESYKNIKELIIQLSEVINGFDFEITWDKVFNVYYPKIGSRRQDIVFSYPNGNITSLGHLKNGMRMANQVMARGSGFGDDGFNVTVTDATQRGIYKLRQAVPLFNDVSNITTLTEHANGELDSLKAPFEMPDIRLDGNISPVFGSYGIGDEVRISTDDQELFGEINDYFRIDAMELDLDDNDHADVRVRLGR